MDKAMREADKDSNIRITLDGFSIIQNIENEKMPKGFTIQHPEDFCSFSCLSEWALEQQVFLDEYKGITQKGEALNNGETD